MHKPAMLKEQLSLKPTDANGYVVHQGEAKVYFHFTNRGEVRFRD